MPEMEPRQILIVHEGVWEELEKYAANRRLKLVRIPDGADEDGRMFFREEGDGTECERCGHTPTYAFMPKEI